MLLGVLRAVDTNGDGHIDYPGKITRFMPAVSSATGFMPVYLPT